MDVFASFMFSLLLLVTLISRASFSPTSRDETTELWHQNAHEICPPFPNCALGYTCAVYQHPNNCPVCKCVACPVKTCVPRKGELCQWNDEDGIPGCGLCSCENCPPVSQCEPGCLKVEPQVGCSFCKCKNSEKELGTNRRSDSDVDETQRQKIESPRGVFANPSDP